MPETSSYARMLDGRVIRFNRDLSDWETLEEGDWRVLSDVVPGVTFGAVTEAKPLPASEIEALTSPETPAR